MSFPDITIYTTKTCGYCKATKAFLTEHTVPFTEIDVGADQEKAREMIEVSGQMGVPVIVIGDEFVVGYDEEKLKELLKL
ncbi:MAG: NrdH-redoxin [Candidatus Andersenbacteria bacterium RIFCSPHIGHO2_02_FULL_45_11]|uniref:NrdH-redoxin n=1 Tax=Candidatus Andersenbacteria bacterium RIFCSPHIGHO2_12_FULL_45_11 TaxID=1797281 RepID=A0A1G1X1T7_9BACT|nr:MAG: NrdH-redoxin [Candidatus Andersenbacteria bacterium RIFCSPHIGHO2_01_FULL_46_36]OGY33979.1 MAG: NrdH-redoxin [Candidatus Andersenbacteria bacterium RIFCSPHIGHO2_12_FULL_45_11]OGY34546.1 MAG: NrdH-redoxin [Candidatus Andersenbacteria bacterium RIFCSPHIGHO2_02_FULL_45_11]